MVTALVTAMVAMVAAMVTGLGWGHLPPLTSAGGFMHFPMQWSLQWLLVEVGRAKKFFGTTHNAESDDGRAAGTRGRQGRAEGNERIARKKRPGQ